MIRHGQASFSSENYDRLSSLGCLQSEILGEYLSHIGIFFDAIYSGSLERQRHTAERVLERTPEDSRCNLRIQPGLNEYDAKGIVESQVPAMIRDDPNWHLTWSVCKNADPFSGSSREPCAAGSQGVMTRRALNPGRSSVIGYKRPSTEL